MSRHGTLTELFICDIKNLRSISPFSSLSKRDAERFFSYALLLNALKLSLGLEKLPEIIYDENGKPHFEAPCGIHFSLSHSGDYVAAAVSDSPCGVDIEKKKPRPERFMKKIMENESLELEFYELWCLKEAYFKLVGKGELRRPSGIYVSDDKIYGPDGRSTGRVYDAVSGYALALFSYSEELPTKPVSLTSEELINSALRIEYY